MADDAHMNRLKPALTPELQVRGFNIIFARGQYILLNCLLAKRLYRYKIRLYEAYTVTVSLSCFFFANLPYIKENNYRRYRKDKQKKL